MPNAFIIGSVFQLRRHTLQPSGVLHKDLDHVTRSPGLLFSEARRRLLAYPIPYCDERNLLYYLLFYPDFPVFSTQQDLES